MSWSVLAGPPGVLEPLPGPPSVAVAVTSRDLFADPPALAVRTEVLQAVGGPEPVRAGALADLVDRLEDAGHRVEHRTVGMPRRRRTAGAVRREGAGRFWLWRRRPERHPLPRPSAVGWWPYPLLVLGALRANGDPTPPVTPSGRSRPGR